MEQGNLLERREESAMSDARRFRVVAIIAAAVCLPFALAHLYLVFGVVPTFARMYQDMGGDMPAATQTMIALSRNGVLAILLLGIDVAIFALMYQLAKRYWIGLLFVPLFAYLAINSVFASVLYAPMFQVINLVG